MTKPLSNSECKRVIKAIKKTHKLPIFKGLAKYKKLRDIEAQKKGQWKVIKCDCGCGGYFISWVRINRNGEIANFSQARLIASAPELLEVYKEIVLKNKKSLLEDFCYQGAEGGKKYAKEWGKYYEGYNKCLQEIKGMLEQVIAKAE